MIYDITQPLFECDVFPGDPSPKKDIILRIEKGDVCNLTGFSMCAHNGTHIDAPFHFYKDGEGVDQIGLNRFIGPAFVVSHEGNVTAKDAKDILDKAARALPKSKDKILIKGKATVTLEAAEVFAASGIDLIGNESQTVGPEDGPMAVHLTLLGAKVVLLEGIRLESVPDGVYYLNCAPLNLTDTDGAPCRAVLIDLGELSDIG